MRGCRFVFACITACGLLAAPAARADLSNISEALGVFQEVISTVESLQGDDGYYYDDEGYDQYGYDEDGYDRDGYDEEGYDEEGYDEDGYDEEGYDRDGNHWEDEDE